MPLSDGTDRASRSAPQAISNNAPVTVAEPVGSRGALLAAHARALDSRLRLAALSDRQATRRAAAHVVQLARRISRLLPRVPTLLPVLPDSGRDGRVRHYVLQAQPVVGTGGTRILTISTHSVLRYSEFDGTGKPVVWNEYDPLQPVAGWSLEVVLERLAQVLGQIQEEVEQLEARVAARASNLNSLLNATPLAKANTASASATSGPARPASPMTPAKPVVAATTRPVVPVTSKPVTPVTIKPVVVPKPVVVSKPIDVSPVAVPAPPEVPASVDTQPVAHDAIVETSAAADDLLPELALIDLAFAAISGLPVTDAQHDADGAQRALPESDEETADRSGSVKVAAALDTPVDAPVDAPAAERVDVPVAALVDATGGAVARARGDLVGAVADDAPLEAVSALTVVVPSMDNAAGAEREKRERRLFQHLRNR